MRHLIILAAIFLFSSCGKQPARQTPQSSTAQNAAQNNYRNNVSLVSSVSPASSRPGRDSNFSWYDSDGKQVSLSDFKGKTVLINFWATWCGPCKAELPDLEAVSKEYASKGLVVIGVSVDKGDNLLNDVSSFAAGNGLTYQIVIDNDNIADAYGNINAIPTSFLVNKDGKIVDKWIGTRDRAFFEATVKNYLD